VVGAGLIAGCPPTEPIPPAPTLPAYPAALAAWPPAPARGEIGRGVALATPEPEPISAAAGVDGPGLSVRALATVPGAGPARAVVSGLIGDQFAVELVDVDDGVVRWRDASRCSAPVVLVTAEVVVCTDGGAAIGLAIADGAQLWRKPIEVTGGQGGFLLAAGTLPAPRPVVPAAHPARPARPAPHARPAPPAPAAAPALPGAPAPTIPALVVVEPTHGDEVARAPLPAGVGPAEAHAACRTADGFDVWAWTAGAVRRIAIDGKGARLAWQLGVAAPLDVDVSAADDRCADTILVAVPDGDGELLYALDRVTGALRAPAVAAFGHWRARAGEGFEIATASGVERRDRALGPATVISGARLAGLVAARGDRRLVRSRGPRLALIDGRGAVTTLAAPVGVGLAVLGDRAIVSGPWRGIRTLADDLRRFALPGPFDGGRDAPLWPAVALDDADLAQHLDLPAPRAIEDTTAVAQPGVGMHAVGAVVVDPDDPAQLYAVPLEDNPSVRTGAGLSAFDLRARRWRWHRADGCPPGTPSSIGFTGDAIVCAAEVEMAHRGAVRATRRSDGAPLWEWTGRTVSEVDAAGGAVAILSGGRVFVLDAATGAELDRFAADDGWLPRLAVVRARGATLIVTAERGQVVARIAGLALPAWAVQVRGLVTGLVPAGDRVAVSLDSGELYLLDAATGAGQPLGGLGSPWLALGADLFVLQRQDNLRREWRLTGYSADGVRRFRDALDLPGPWLLSSARSARAALPLAWGPALRNAALVEPRTGALLGLFALPARAVGGLVFATIVDGAPVAGAVLSHPLAVVTF
jgi:hypothetical protein